MSLLLQANKTPVPRNIPLALPLPEWLLVIILVLSFLLHILFVNLMVGGSILTLWAEIRGKRDSDYDVFANELAKTVTVNKSLAVVLGIAPLLSINVLYTVYFYSANALTGFMWILIIPLVTVAFLLTYLHKYTWEVMQAYKSLHIAIIGLAVLIFLFIPLIFLVNINLMLFPEKWGSIQGFFSALALPNVFPRYFHFICASLAVTGLFICWYARRPNYPVEQLFTKWTRYDIIRIGYTLALAASTAQFFFGPLLLVTLPSKGIGINLIGVILTGAILALPAMWWMWKGLTGARAHIDRNFWKVVLFFSLTVLFMASGRHVYRANALEPHQKLMAAQTAEFEKQSKEAREGAAINSAEGVKENGDAPGEAIFKANCSACHAKDRKIVGPPMTEMVEIYQGKQEDMKHWILSPGKKRADAPQMPGFPQLTDKQLNDLTIYILSIQ
ncbi:c-type cytochrome [Olivibacter sp. LS-1]|uniref:c-type cytochrome n=1 Tax=Olivibacter sp. LS-1 TaxID=2592345 RepID=UPI0011EB0C6A|nr:cytochrome c [Olivibacter sp. LS-1]QEL02618.1 c-type cytochrome [Olivibacter sp. LS-1]